VLEGEVAMFELLMRRHNQQVYRAVRAVLRDEAEGRRRHAAGLSVGGIGTWRSSWRGQGLDLADAGIALNEALGRG